MNNYERYFGTPERAAETVWNILDAIFPRKSDNYEKKLQFAYELYSPPNHLKWLQEECE